MKCKNRQFYSLDPLFRSNLKGTSFIHSALVNRSLLREGFSRTLRGWQVRRVGARPQIAATLVQTSIHSTNRTVARSIRARRFATPTKAFIWTLQRTEQISNRCKRNREPTVPWLRPRPPINQLKTSHTRVQQPMLLQSWVPSLCRSRTIRIILAPWPSTVTQARRVSINRAPHPNCCKLHHSHHPYPHNSNSSKPHRPKSPLKSAKPRLERSQCLAPVKPSDGLSIACSQLTKLLRLPSGRTTSQPALSKMRQQLTWKPLLTTLTICNRCH